MGTTYSRVSLLEKIVTTCEVACATGVLSQTKYYYSFDYIEVRSVHMHLFINI